MIRCVYRWLLWMHPPEFRDRFAEEMLAIFDETGFGVASRALLPDALASLARQWFLRGRAWRVAPAVLVAAMQCVFFIPMFHFHRRSAGQVHPIFPASPGRDIILLIALSASAVAVLVVIASLHVQYMLRSLSNPPRHSARCSRAIRAGN